MFKLNLQHSYGSYMCIIGLLSVLNGESCFSWVQCILLENKLLNKVIEPKKEIIFEIVCKRVNILTFHQFN